MGRNKSTQNVEKLQGCVHDVPRRWWQDNLKSYERARLREILGSIKNGEPELNKIVSHFNATDLLTFSVQHYVMATCVRLMKLFSCQLPDDRCHCLETDGFLKKETL